MSAETALPAVDFDGYTAHVNPTLGRFLQLTGRDARFVRADGMTLEDEQGRRYDDWVSGFGTLALGHNPPDLKRVLRAHLDEETPNLYVEGLNPYAGALAARLVEAAGPEFETCWFGNSGAEAVEAAIKTALLATGRPRIAYAEGGFHGTTLGALACMARGPYRDPLAATLPAFIEVPFDDLPALEAALAQGDVGAFLMEPIQVESGVRIVSGAFLPQARAACHRHGALFLLDEVQTGLGRTGARFAFQDAGAPPDVLILAKALGGGMVPIGATIMARGLWERAYGGVLRCEIHASTLGGNGLACRVAMEALARLTDPGLLARVRERGGALFARLEKALAGSPIVEAVRGRGLLGGIALRQPSHPWLRWENLGLPELGGRPSVGPLLVDRLWRRGIVAQVCGHDWSVLRVEPPLTVDAAACDRFVDAVADGVRWLEGRA